MSLKLGKIIFFLGLYLHCIGCLWFFIAKQNETWIPPSNFLYPNIESVYSIEWVHQYYYSLYHSVLILTGIDVGPRGNLQIGLVTIFTVAGEMINAFIFAELAVVLAVMNRKSAVYQEKVDII